MKRRSLFAAVTALAMSVAVIAPAIAYPGPGALSNKNMEWMFNQPQGVGSDIEFLEMKQADGTLKRYAITGSMANGFNIYEITSTNPPLAVPAGTFVDPGVNWQGDVQVNPRRKIVVLSTEGAIGVTASHGVGDGIAFVDVSTPATPRLLGVSNFSSAHNATILNDQYVITLSGGNRLIDYTNPASPVDKGSIPGMCGGHDLTVDPNRPHIVYNACGSSRTQIWDLTDPLKPIRLAEINDNRVSIAHQADPNLDSSLLFITDERGGGTSNVNVPGGGVHVWDISGKYVAGASITSPKKLGVWFAPLAGPAGTVSAAAGNRWGNLTAHNMTFQAERNLLSIGWYTMGTFVADMNAATLASGGLYDEYKGTVNGGPTTWGNTTGNILLEGEENWASKWTRFDDPAYDTLIYTNGLTRGMDVLKYNGPMPKKQARLAVNSAAPGGLVSGKLDRYAVWTYDGWVNKPLAGQTVSLTVGSQTVQATTGPDGTFSAQLVDLAAGTNTVQATWAGNATYDAASVSQAVTV